MRCNLPAITKKRADWLFENVFEDVFSESGRHCQDMIETNEYNDRTESDFRLLRALKAMQHYNIAKRENDCINLYRIFSDPYFLDGNSEGTTHWLAMALAIKELYDLDDNALRRVIMGRNA